MFLRNTNPERARGRHPELCHNDYGFQLRLPDGYADHARADRALAASGLVNRRGMVISAALSRRLDEITSRAGKGHANEEELDLLREHNGGKLSF